MLELKPFNPIDAETVLSWVSTEPAFYKWSANRLGEFPGKKENMLAHYNSEHDFYPMAMWDGSSLVGHFIIRRISDDEMRLGFIVVNPSIRGMGYGKKMLALAIEYIKKNFTCRKVTLGVFTSNPQAYHCYVASGFRETGESYMFSHKSYSWRCNTLEYIL